MAERGRVRVEQGHKQVRGYVSGALVFATTRPVLVWEVPYYPAYYVPVEDVVADLKATGEVRHSPSRGDSDVLDVHAGGVTVPAAAVRYAASPIPELRDLVRFDWEALDDWFEEDEPIYTHPRDPYTRVDVLASSRNVRVVVDGVTVADSSSPRILYETGLPPRFYLPMTDVRMDLLQPSSTRSHCPYKGEASYWSLTIEGSGHDDAFWAYRSPFPESQKIAGLGCFYNEKVDIYLDGVLQDRPRTHFS
ncbi:MAG: hypothetical protein DLM59_19085 [Pseudonocardiales bacterium]|nr:MAG: hypothetical protein DLM59_19085 [Pseudonocardiales bacterium]